MRQIRSIDTHIRDVINSQPMDKTRRAFLVGPHTTFGNVVLVQFNDPIAGSRGATVRAKVRPGLVLPNRADGTPVLISTRHGKVEVVG